MTDREPFSLIVARRNAAGSGNAVGAVFRARSDAGLHWVLSLEIRAANVDDISRLLGLLYLDQAVEVLRPILVPYRPSAGVLLDDGRLWDRNVDAVIPKASQTEVDRIAGRLRGAHISYLRTLRAFLREGDRSGFAPVPEEFPMGDVAGMEAATAPTPPDIAVRADWRNHRPGDNS